MTLERISYGQLNARQKENFNFQKVSAVLADYGYVTIRLTDDWNGADFLALHISGAALRVQLKGRLTFAQKYVDRDLYVVFPDEGSWYLCPHDELLQKVQSMGTMGATRSWQEDGDYHYPRLSKELREILEPYRIVGDTNGVSG